jgi:septum formation topological specificity factor MinE
MIKAYKKEGLDGVVKYMKSSSAFKSYFDNLKEKRMNVVQYLKVENEKMDINSFFDKNGKSTKPHFIMQKPK